MINVNYHKKMKPIFENNKLILSNKHSDDVNWKNISKDSFLDIKFIIDCIDKLDHETLLNHNTSLSTSLKDYLRRKK